MTVVPQLRSTLRCVNLFGCCSLCLMSTNCLCEQARPRACACACARARVHAHAHAHAHRPRVVYPVFCSSANEFEVEAKEILYGENVFRFMFTREHIASRGSTFDLTPTEAARQVRKCELVIGDSLYEAEVYRRIQKWMQFVACRLAGVHRLLELHIDLRTGEFEKARWSEYFKLWVDGQVARIYQYCLEPLALLTRVSKVRITGHVDEGFAKALTEVMMKDPKKAALVRRLYSSGSKIGSDNVTGTSVISPVTADKRRFFDPDWIW